MSDILNETNRLADSLAAATSEFADPNPNTHDLNGGSRSTSITIIWDPI